MPKPTQTDILNEIAKRKHARWLHEHTFRIQQIIQARLDRVIADFEANLKVALEQQYADLAEVHRS
jgi:hypothetical protein